MLYRYLGSSACGIQPLLWVSLLLPENHDVIDAGVHRVDDIEGDAQLREGIPRRSFLSGSWVNIGHACRRACAMEADRPEDPGWVDKPGVRASALPRRARTVLREDELERSLEVRGEIGLASRLRSESTERARSAGRPESRKALGRRCLHQGVHCAEELDMTGHLKPS
ncbi:hypothetical protein SCP_0505350 [Sparassis crispa]|uniref:Uncharacterized protein n=1 Tax=Sparassis crispa TaxID=139825 RepID=A0A401GMP6_9APHY|nr:hypothetical protein SCP_0505350 [Sparassis crispa]GBE83486.1 hypothetical protein SCP_0505350 [Sparassis crispa]